MSDSVVLDDLAGTGCAEELFHQTVAAADLHFFGEDAEGGFGGDEVDVGDAGVGVESPEHLGGEDGAAGAGDGEGKFQVWRGRIRLGESRM